MEAAVPAAERGATRIAERVVARLAAQAAREALADAGQGPPVPRRRGGGTPTPHATAALRRLAGGDGGQALASIRVTVELGYPSDIGAQCAAVRRHVTLRVKQLAGMDTSEVAVDVERLHSVHFDGDGSAAGRVR
ncbi:hypothetical protein [Streptomyces sp. 6N223]|uniref:hypothetical protein n=1 Tax=Streptomyces sp. 6N223 TaxID=3457412 RepID=UPI003FD31911